MSFLSRFSNNNIVPAFSYQHIEEFVILLFFSILLFDNSILRFLYSRF